MGVIHKNSSSNFRENKFGFEVAGGGTEKNGALGRGVGKGPNKNRVRSRGGGKRNRVRAREGGIAGTKIEFILAMECEVIKKSRSHKLS